DALGIAAAKRRRWTRGVDCERFRPVVRPPTDAGHLNVLYCGRLTTEKGVDLLADAFLAARRREPRLRLTLAGDGPERTLLERRRAPAIMGDGAGPARRRLPPRAVRARPRLASCRLTAPRGCASPTSRSSTASAAAASGPITTPRRTMRAAARRSSTTCSSP